ncbi:MAG TPA: sensor histidine kinase, partial [Chthonomonadales bacterium]|nr:sensor histidine kinase [Chthonomonadales bacterium]
RVKNNLQLIAAMLDMRLLEGNALIPANEIKRVSGSVRTLAAIHDILTQQAKEDRSAHTVSAREVLSRLISMLQETAVGREIRYNIQEVRLPSRQGTSLALVVNELVNNAVKHGEGAIDVDLEVEDAEVVVAVTDCGKGFPADFKSEAASSTGLELLQNLVRWDLGGHALFENRPEGGARCEVHVPLAQRHHRTGVRNSPHRE